MPNVEVNINGLITVAHHKSFEIQALLHNAGKLSSLEYFKSRKSINKIFEVCFIHTVTVVCLLRQKHSILRTEINRYIAMMSINVHNRSFRYKAFPRMNTPYTASSHILPMYQFTLQKLFMCFLRRLINYT